MKNKFYSLQQEDYTLLSKLGLNIKHVHSSKTKTRMCYDIPDIISEIENQKRNVEKNSLCSIEHFIACSFIKKRAMVKNIYPYVNFVLSHTLVKVLKDKEAKSILLERLDLLILQLNMLNEPVGMAS